LNRTKKRSVLGGPLSQRADRKDGRVEEYKRERGCIGRTTCSSHRYEMSFAHSAPCGSSFIIYSSRSSNCSPSMCSCAVAGTPICQFVSEAPMQGLDSDHLNHVRIILVRHKCLGLCSQGQVVVRMAGHLVTRCGRSWRIDNRGRREVRCNRLLWFSLADLGCRGRSRALPWAALSSSFGRVFGLRV
jgi:hypothetical protein